MCAGNETTKYKYDPDIRKLKFKIMGKIIKKYLKILDASFSKTAKSS